MNKNLTYSLAGLGVILAGYFTYNKFFPKAEAVTEDQPQTRSSGAGMGSYSPGAETATIPAQTVKPAIFASQKPIIQAIRPSQVITFKPVVLPVRPIVVPTPTFQSKPSALISKAFNGE